MKAELKPISEWIEQLPESLQVKALDYAHINNGPEDLDVEVKSLRAALNAAFKWEDTREGAAYWDSISNEYTNRKTA